MKGCSGSDEDSRDENKHVEGDEKWILRVHVEDLNHKMRERYGDKDNSSAIGSNLENLAYFTRLTGLDYDDAGADAQKYNESQGV
ncbi:hypothetical protein NW757_013330 [Fusarium falciforme]|nr:hypothetical protein NW757_013330 [Fusarium falciforme]